MDIKLKDLKLEKIRDEIKISNGELTIKVFNPIGNKRDELLHKLIDTANSYTDEDFEEVWYKYLIKNFTNVKDGDIKIRTLLESPKVEFLHLKRSLDDLTNEVYLDMLLNQINELQQQKIGVYGDLLSKNISQLNEANNISEV